MVCRDWNRLPHAFVVFDLSGVHPWLMFMVSGLGKLPRGSS